MCKLYSYVGVPMCEEPCVWSMCVEHVVCGACVCGACVWSMCVEHVCGACVWSHVCGAMCVEPCVWSHVCGACVWSMCVDAYISVTVLCCVHYITYAFKNAVALRLYHIAA